MSLLTKNRDLVDTILSDITLKLRNRESFGRASAMDCFDVIQLNGFLTIVPSYVYVNIDVKEDDLMDPNAIVDKFVREWCKYDDTKSIRSFQQFVKDGERWGWD